MKRPALLAAVLLGRLSTGLVAKPPRYPRYNLWSTNMASTGSPSAIRSAGSDAETMPGTSTLFAHLDYVSKWDLVLASQSPRRREIVELMGFGDRARIVVSNFEENLDKTSFSDPRDYAIANAEGKAREVAGRVFTAQASGEGEGEGGMSAPVVVIGSDTIVDLDGRILEKPSDDEHAFSMLSSLSGRRHLVHSGVSLFTSRAGKEHAAISFCETTEVSFTTLSAQEIRAYIRTREPMDKSGSYGIQGAGGQFVRKIEGCYFNVMGFPIHAFSRHMAALIEGGKA